ncbi:MAG: mercuric reductase, partial [Flavobacteriales bacterium]|nr:mercuric reductase [Flavobacteriales bacterium]
HLGGTCVNVGCTPTKAYVASARRMWETKHGDALGVIIPKGSILNLKKVKSRKDALIQDSVSGIKAGIEKEKNITYFKGEASFSGPKTVTVNKKELSAEIIYINVGARPSIPDEFKDIPYLTSQTILELEKLPEHLIIVGGSYIGLEFGQMFRRFGSKVTIIEKGDAIISKEDTDVSKAIQDILEDEKVKFRLDATCIGGKKNKDSSIAVQVDCKKGSPKIKGSHLLLAVGRTPNTDTLNLKAAGVQTDKRGYITVNDYLETNVSGIYALGDCNGRGAFTHTAYNDYEIITANIQKTKSRKVTDRILTYGLFIDPPLGRAGLTKKDAKDKGYEVMEAFRPMDKIARAKEKGETKGFMRVLVDKKTDKIVGASILGVGGDEIITSILNIMYADVPYSVIRDSVVPHPTVSELIPTMLENLKKV